MVQGLESSNIFTPQEMHQKVLMQKLVSYDKDNKAGLSKAEINKYALDGGEMTEFAKKLVEKFEQVDQNKDGQVSTEEMNALQNNRGLWSVNALGLSPAALGAATTASQQQGVLGENSTDLLSKNIQSLVKKGTTIANNNPDLLKKLEGVVHKII